MECCTLTFCRISFLKFRRFFILFHSIGLFRFKYVFAFHKMFLIICGSLFTFSTYASCAFFIAFTLRNSMEIKAQNLLTW